ncbi:MAG: hypothetical protein K2X47_14465, partial [Bdellovibrionales bacterium]|nr:hypothetical protein [Bdellovibrionales bacterium]
LKQKPPGAIELPLELREGLVGDWRAMAKQRGWKYIEFYSPSVAFENQDEPNVNTYRRLVFYIPNDRGFQKWIQFVPPQTRNNNIEKVYHADLIAIDKDAQGRYQQHHNQFVRGSVNEAFVQKPLSDLSRCVACHSSGPRIIRPWPGYVTEGNISASALEKIMAPSRSANWAGALDLTAMGPGLGKNQGCTACHGFTGSGSRALNGLGILHDEFSLQQIRHKMVESLQMPPSFLQQERFQELKAAIVFLENMTDQQKTSIAESDKDSYATLISAVQAKGFIDGVLAQKALAQLEVAQAEAKSNYRQLIADQKVNLKKWLSGESVPACR